jgi:hypothetical protein
VLHRFAGVRLDHAKGFLYKPGVKSGNVIRIILVPGICRGPLFRQSGRLFSMPVGCNRLQAAGRFRYAPLTGYVSPPVESSPKRLTCEHPRRIAIGGATVQRDCHAVSLALPLDAYKLFAPTSVTSTQSSGMALGQAREGA